VRGVDSRPLALAGLVLKPRTPLKRSMEGWIVVSVGFFFFVPARRPLSGRQATLEPLCFPISRRSIGTAGVTSMPYRVTWFFEQSAFGWSESHTHESDDPVVVRNDAGEYTQVRILTLAQPARCTYVRISQEDVFRDVRRGDPRLDLTLGSVITQPIKVSNYPESSLLFKMTGALNAAAQHAFYLRPAPGGSGHDGDRRVIGPSFAAQFPNLRQILIRIGTPWGFITSFLVGNDAIRVTKLEQLAGPITRLTTAVPHTIVAGQKVRLLFVRSADTETPLPTTTFKCINPTAMTLDLDPPIPAAIPLKVSDKAAVRRITTGFMRYGAMDFIRVVGRQTGRPFDAPRGRRRRGR